MTMNASTVHPRVLWSTLVGTGYAFLIYELQKHGVWQPDAAEASFIGVAVTFATGYLKRVDGEDPSDAPIGAPLVTVQAPGATVRSTDVEIAKLQPEATMHDDLSIPAKPTGAAAATAAIFLAIGFGISGCAAPVPGAPPSIAPIELPSAALPPAKALLTDTAKAACSQQALLNKIAEVGGTVAGSAIGMPFVGTIGADAASALVGVGCTWVNTL